MPFPPTFDRAWDETFPPDSQQANLLGQDIRNFKTDIRERLALLSGTLANRPANMDAIYGAAAFGIPYFATDTGQVFQWNGAAWVVTSLGQIKLVNATPVTIVNPVAVTDGLSVTIPAGLLQINSVVTIVAGCHISSMTPASVIWSLYFGAGFTPSILGGTFFAAPNDSGVVANLIMTGATTQIAYAFGFISNNLLGGRSTGLNQTIANLVTIHSAVNTAGTLSITFDYLSVIINV
jgi:hypothetical protein